MDDEGIRQRILLQPTDQIGQPGALLELFQRLRAGNEFNAGNSRVLRELLAQLVNILRLCLHIQEQADLRCVGKLHDQPLRILQQRVQAGRQAERDADDQNIEEPRQLRGEHAAQHGAQHTGVQREGARHCSTPSFSVSRRTALFCNTLSSWVEINKVTPT